MRGLILGRFQPFHLGHLELVKQCLSECDEIIIAITGSQFSYIQKDPFTAGERITMIKDSLVEAKFDLSRFFIVPVQNQQNNSTWVAYLKSILPNFDYVYTGNEYVDMLVSNSGLKIKQPKFLNREKYRSTVIRQMIHSGDVAWEKYVPPGVTRIIKEIGGIKRIKVIMESDTKPQEF